MWSQTAGMKNQFGIVRPSFPDIGPKTLLFADMQASFAAVIPHDSPFATQGA